MSLRASAIGRLPKPAAKAADARDSGQPVGKRKIWLSGGWRDVAVWNRADVFPGATIEGPAVIEEAYTSVLLVEGWSCQRDSKRPPRGEEAGMNVNVTDAEISPIELEIIYNALTAAAAEMDVTIWRTSRSTIVRELLDYSTAIFDRDGWNVAQAARIPSHLNSMSYFLTEILATSHSARQMGA